MQRGTILCGTITVPDLDAAIAAWRDVLGLELCETGSVDAALAQSWGAEACAGLGFAMLRPRSGDAFWIRLVEQPRHDGFVPTTTYGWAAYELTVQDVFGWAEKLAGSAFEIRLSRRSSAPNSLNVYTLPIGPEGLWKEPVPAWPPRLPV